MKKMKVQGSSEVSPYHAKLEQWTSKELQLNMLHEEIINKREAMLRTSRNFLGGTAEGQLLMNNTDAAIRNDQLLKEMALLEDTIEETLTDHKSPRFANLQANYWSMVKNMFPIWEKSLDEQARGGNSRGTASRGGHL